MSITEWLAMGLALVLGGWALLSGPRRFGLGLTAALALLAWGLALTPLLWLGLAAVAAVLALALIWPEKRPFVWLTSAPHKARQWNRWRDITQWLLVAAMAAAGAQYALHVWQLDSGAPTIARPDVVDAFLPIAALIQLKGLLELGLWDTHHPAGLVMLLAALGLSLTVKRAFCGWACPIGWLGERGYQLRRRLLPVNWRERLAAQPNWLNRSVSVLALMLDWALRLVKYGILAWLVNLLLSGMPAMMVARYLQGLYHQAADLKMWALFTQPSAGMLVGLGVVVALALVRRNGVCRYLCPYGALMAIAGAFSPYKIRRDTALCLRDAKGMNCDKCHRACPSRIHVEVVGTVHSDECHSCQRCVAACPVKGAVSLSAPGRRWPMTPRAMVLVLIGFLFVLPLFFYAAGMWGSDTSPMMRAMLWQRLENLPLF
ncbi:4Fe-4S binding protein [Ferrimonas balearica]|uniref:4Fe-4S binding protein n=1 Tax=Ferrimonas balearica TaxID=44012 RepID=UPI001C58322C|nr:4Fe-4S binding protein [Ferrimonas balearica]MBW3140077.1 4Fe-4S binding protein [Ferrimonas balearica]